MNRARCVLAMLLVLTLAACTAQPERSHNADGGYIDACGELPPLIGDDC